MKLCKDCKNFDPVEYKFLFWTQQGDQRYAKCKAEPLIDKVTGNGGYFCAIERENTSGKCGPEGKLWAQA